MTFTPDLSGTSIGAGGRPKPIKMKPIVSEEMAAMRNWCMGQTGVAQGETTVLLHVSHSNLKKTFFQEIRLDMHMTVVNVKHKLEFHTGTSAVSNTVRALPTERRPAPRTCTTNPQSMRPSPNACRAASGKRKPASRANPACVS